MASSIALDLSSLNPEPEAISAVSELLIAVQWELGDTVIAAWFDGSIALEEFDPSRSDIDLVIVTRDTPSKNQISALRALHARSAAAGPWGDEIETVYVTPAGLRVGAVRSGIHHLYIERGTGGELMSAPLDPGWLVHLRVLREHGRSIFGPAPAGVVETVGDDELRSVALWGSEHWLTPYRENPARLARLGTRVFAVLTMCRLLYTSQTGDVVSKITAARWAQAAAPPNLALVIRGAIAWRKEDVDSANTTVEGVLAMIELTQSVTQNRSANLGPADRNG